MNRAAGSWWCFALTLVCQQIFGGMATAQTNPWKIGAVLCLTGGCANLGTDSVKGAQMALDEINSRGGVLGRTLKLVVQDTSEAVSGAQAVSAYKQLRTDKDIHYFIGPTWAPAGLALAPIVAQEKDIVMMSPSLGAPEFHKAGENIFNSRGTDEVASRMAARYAFKKGFKRAAIFSSQQPWETAQADFFEDEFTKLGGSLVMRVEPLPTVSDVGTEALRIVSKKPDVVFISTMVLMPRAARKLRELKYAGFLMGSYIDETRITESQGTLEGAVFYGYKQPTGAFRDQFFKKYREYPLREGATAYDTINVFAQAVQQAGTFDPEKVIKAIKTIKMDGGSGGFSFDSQGCAVRELVASKIVGAGYEGL